MKRPSIRRRGFALIASGAMLAATLATASGASASTTAAEPPSTPVPMAFPDGYLMSYVINTKATPGTVTAVEQAVARSGGVVVQSWPQIGVVVAQSDRAAFRARMKTAVGSVVQSIGATRTAAVSEGTPDGIATPWRSGARTAPKAKAKVGTGLDLVSDEQAVTPDPREGEQWDMQQIKADQAHQITDGSRDVVVGVLDSGIDPDHPDLQPNIDVADSVNCTNAGRPDLSPTGWYPTTSDHGTHVAGTIGAARNGTGIVGVAPNVRMASVKVVNDDGFIYPEYAVCGFMWAGLKGMDVTNNSYYVDPMEFWCNDQVDQAAVLEAVNRAVQWSTKQGAVHAAAAGNSAYDLANKTTNDSSPNDTTPIPRVINNECYDIPTELPGVVTTSATTRTEQLAYFSNRGLGVIDVAAPGRSILSTIVAGNGYGLKSGTSMASPHVAGVLALMKSAHPDLTPAQMVAKLKADARDVACQPAEAAPPGRTNGAPCVGSPSNNSFYGDGIIDALKAVS